MTTLDSELNKALDKWYITFPRDSFKHDIKLALETWLKNTLQIANPIELEKRSAKWMLILLLEEITIYKIGDETDAQY